MKLVHSKPIQLRGQTENNRFHIPHYWCSQDEVILMISRRKKNDPSTLLFSESESRPTKVQGGKKFSNQQFGRLRYLEKSTQQC